MNQIFDIDARLNDLWDRRGKLSKTEWEELFKIIYKILKKPNNKIKSFLNSLENELDDYINEFFISKVLTKDGTRNKTNTGYLLGFFYNFLIDKLNSERKHKDGKVYFDDDSTDSNDNKRSAKISEIEDEQSFNFSADILEETLIYHNFTRQQLTESAKQFFTELQQWQQQVLGLYLCSNSAMPLAQFQEQYAVTATYYKVRQLGVVQTVAALPDDYPNTKIGRWITQTLGLDLCRDNYEMLGIVLQILCLVALQVLDD